MNRLEFTNRLIDASLRFNPVSVRMHKDANYGLDVQTYSLWIVGERSIDETLCMASDSFALCVRFRSYDKAIKERDKMRKWMK